MPFPEQKKTEKAKFHAHNENLVFLNCKSYEKMFYTKVAEHKISHQLTFKITNPGKFKNDTLQTGLILKLRKIPLAAETVS